MIAFERRLHHQPLFLCQPFGISVKADNSKLNLILLREEQSRQALELPCSPQSVKPTAAAFCYSSQRRGLLLDTSMRVSLCWTNNFILGLGSNTWRTRIGNTLPRVRTAGLTDTLSAQVAHRK